jgi:acyl carrier protein
VIHAAGITTASSIPDLTPQECADHFKPKAHGLYTLEDLLEGVELDFCVLLSSTASVLGGLGYFAYSAANNFMDAFSQRRNRTSRVPWISSNWDSWAEEEEFLAHAGDGGKFNNLFMRPGESAEAMERVLNEGMAPQVIVAISDLDNRIEQWIKPESQSPAEPNARGNASHSRPSLQTIYVGPTNEIEQSLVEIWQEVLGIDRIGIHDNFFELGGHSLLGTRIIARVRRTFSIDFPVRLIFDTPTISKFSEVIIERQAGQVGEEALAQLISELDQLSEEGAELLLMSKEKFEAVAG